VIEKYITKALQKLKATPKKLTRGDYIP